MSLDSRLLGTSTTTTSPDVTKQLSSDIKPLIHRFTMAACFDIICYTLTSKHPFSHEGWAYILQLPTEPCK